MGYKEAYKVTEKENKDFLIDFWLYKKRLRYKLMSNYTSTLCPLQ